MEIPPLSETHLNATLLCKKVKHQGQTKRSNAPKALSTLATIIVADFGELSPNSATIVASEDRALNLPSRGRYSFTDHERMEG